MGSLSLDHYWSTAVHSYTLANYYAQNFLFLIDCVDRQYIIIIIFSFVKRRRHEKTQVEYLSEVGCFLAGRESFTADLHIIVIRIMLD